MKIEGARILITGAGRRLGAIMADALQQRGAKIILHYHTAEAEAQARLQTWGGAACGHEALCADLTQIGAAEKLFAAATRNGPIDVLINNASRYDLLSVPDETASIARALFELHYFAPRLLSQAFFAQKRAGCIVNILDHRVDYAVNQGASYGISKKALRDLTLVCARDFAPAVRVNALAPGPVLPPPQFEHAGMQKSIASLPLKRAVDVQDVCASLAFLIENESVTGHVLHCDCGGALNVL